MISLLVEHKTVFGNELWYPADDDGEVIVRLMGRKAFTPEHVEQMKKAGWDIKAKQVEV